MRLESKYVLTGGPGVGKTTTLRELERLGCQVVPESARMVIAEEQQKPDGALPWIRPLEFQQKVAERQLLLEERVRGSTAFLDRCLIDVIAFHRFYRIPMNPELPFIARQQGYRHAFVFEPLPTYVTDAQRREDPGAARAIHELIIQTYQELDYVLGITMTQVPVMTPEARARYILTKLERPEVD
jgi:predicted ATPase